ncbi:MAG: ankyrin repeat domain-containing protein [Bacilli bacterium]|nr:ankyrin repeat domain-containing protein [Bacilli bacterium]
MTINDEEVVLSKEDKKVLATFFDDNIEFLREKDLSNYENIKCFADTYQEYINDNNLNDNSILMLFLTELRYSQLSYKINQHKENQTSNNQAFSKSNFINNKIIEKWYNEKYGESERRLRLILDNYSLHSPTLFELILTIEKEKNIEIISEVELKKSQKEDRMHQLNEIIYTKMIDILIEDGVDVTIDDNHAIKWAACNGFENCVTSLIKAGADVTADHNNAVRYAAWYDYPKIIKILIKAGANVTDEDNFAIKWAAKNDCSQETIDILIAAGADKKIYDRIIAEKEIKENEQKNSKGISRFISKLKRIK